GRCVALGQNAAVLLAQRFLTAGGIIFKLQRGPFRLVAFHTGGPGLKLLLPAGVLFFKPVFDLANALLDGIALHLLLAGVNHTPGFVVIVQVSKELVVLLLADGVILVVM